MNKRFYGSCFEYLDRKTINLRWYVRVSALDIDSKDVPDVSHARDSGLSEKSRFDGLPESKNTHRATTCDSILMVPMFVAPTKFSGVIAGWNPAFAMLT